MMTSPTLIERTDQIVAFTRTFNAPRELVFQAFTKAEFVSKWWGKANWPVVACSLDFTVGGVWHYCLQGPDGQVHWAKAIYREIIVPERIVYVEGSSDEAGNEIDGLPPATVTVTFTQEDGRTKLTSLVTYATAADLESVIARGMIQGFTQTLDNLDSYLQTGEARHG